MALTHADEELQILKSDNEKVSESETENESAVHHFSTVHG